MEPSAEAAARLLRGNDEVRERVERRGPSRSFALFMLGLAAVVAVYLGVFMLSFGSRSIDEMATSVGTYSNALLFPFLIFTSLVSGARERFDIRRKPSPGYWIALGLVVVAFCIPLVAMFNEVVYPRWMNLLAPVAVFVAMAASPIRQLRLANTSDSAQWASEPLSRPVRWTTSAIGVATGLIAATSTQPWFPIVSWSTLILLLVVLASWLAPWGLPRTGFEWGPLHWGAFLIAVSILYALTLLLTRTTWITTWIAVGAGVTIAAVLLVAASLPARPRHA